MKFQITITEKIVPYAEGMVIVYKHKTRGKGYVSQIHEGKILNYSKIIAHVGSIGGGDPWLPDFQKQFHSVSQNSIKCLKNYYCIYTS